MGKVFEERKLDIDLYINGFNHEQVDCVNMPIAGAAGFYNYDNYFYYSFYTSIFKNWLEGNIGLGWGDYQKHFLANLGLEIGKHSIGNTSTLFSFIEQSIDDFIPLVMVVKYNSLFYFASYLDETNRFDHGVIIHGYDVERPLLYIRDVKVVDRIRNPAIKEILDAEPLFELQLTNDMLAEIWEKTNLSFKEEKSDLHNLIFSVRKSGEAKINSYQDLVKDLENYELKSNKLIEKINDNGFMERLCKDSFEADLFRRVYYHSLIPFFYVLEKSVENNEELKNKVMCFKTKYLGSRNTLISKFMKMAYKNKNLEGNTKKELTQKSKDIDDELNLFINKLNSDLI